MMHDRFDAQLREHLLGTADTSPADGQLAAVVRSVAGTAQRRPFAARLTWYPGRVGSFPTRTLRFGLVALALIGAMLAAVLYVGSGPSRSTVFEGTWTTTDAGDGSAESLIVGKGATPEVRFVDHYATGLACRDDAVKVFTADGHGTIDGSSLHVTFPDGGGCGSRIVDVGPFDFSYDHATDTIHDAEQVTWSRASDGFVPPSAGPATTASPTAPGPTDTAMCIQFDGPGTYTAPLVYRSAPGSLQLTVDVGVVGDAWIGLRDRFSLMNAACADQQANAAIDAAQISTVYTDGCTGVSVPVGSAAQAAAALSSAKHLSVVDQRDVNLNGDVGTAIRMDMLASDSENACQDGQVSVSDDLNPMDRGLDFTLYLVDAGDGQVVALALYGNNAWSAALVAQVDGILGSLRISGAPTPASPEPTSRTACMEFDGAGIYTAPVANNLVVVTLPSQPGTTWSGLPDRFALFRAPCGFGGPLTFEASTIDEVSTDACAWKGGGTAASDAAVAARALAEQAGIVVTGQRDLTIDGNPAVEVRLSIPADTQVDACDRGLVSLWMDADGTSTSFAPGMAMTLYLIDFNDAVTAIAAQYAAGDDVSDPDLRSQIDAIIGSLEIKVAGGISG